MKKITEAKVIPLSHTHDCPHVWLDTATWIKSGGVKLFYGNKPPLLSLDNKNHNNILHHKLQQIITWRWFDGLEFQLF